MKRFLFSAPVAGLGALVVGLGMTPAALAAHAGPNSVDTSGCSNPLLSQPFQSHRDNNEYMFLPGDAQGSFTGAGWTLSGGAKVVTTTLDDGTQASVLDLPSGSRAVSPTVCVTSEYPTARAIVRNVVGSEGVFVYFSYEGTNTWNNPQNTGQVHGQHTAWTLSDSVNVQPNGTSGWQPVRFTFVPGGKTSDFQLYDFAVDPHMKM